MTADGSNFDILFKYMKNGGAATILFVILGLFLDFYNVFNLNQIPIPNFRLFLWFYLLVNAGIATPFHYLKERGSATCPKCGKALKVDSQFTCLDCGKITFKKN